MAVLHMTIIQFKKPLKTQNFLYMVGEKKWSEQSTVIFSRVSWSEPSVKNSNI